MTHLVRTLALLATWYAFSLTLLLALGDRPAQAIRWSVLLAAGMTAGTVCGKRRVDGR